MSRWGSATRSVFLFFFILFHISLMRYPENGICSKIASYGRVEDKRGLGVYRNYTDMVCSLSFG